MISLVFAVAALGVAAFVVEQSLDHDDHVQYVDGSPMRVEIAQPGERSISGPDEHGFLHYKIRQPFENYKLVVHRGTKSHGRCVFDPVDETVEDEYTEEIASNPKTCVTVEASGGPR
jgi:hypothetical protein